MKKNIFVLIAVLITFASCSSAPDNPGDDFTLRNLAENDLANALQAAGRGDNVTALELLRNCKNTAVLTDDWSLIIRCGLSFGNVLFTNNQIDEAFTEWDEAITLAQRFGDRELLSTARIYRLRGELLSRRKDPDIVHSEVASEASNIRRDQLHIAFSWQVRALALRQMENFTEAEQAAQRSLEIHRKERYLENASFDWYLIGSIRSLSGNPQGAVEALQNSIEFDRRVENSWGLAASWRAVGDIQSREGNKDEAITAYTRAAAIYRALMHERLAEEIDVLIGNL